MPKAKCVRSEGTCFLYAALAAVAAFQMFPVQCLAALPAADASGKITLTEDVTVDSSGDAALLASASALEIPAGVTLRYVAADALALSAAVSGSGVFSAESSGAITLSADNSGLLSPGHFAFSSTPVVVTDERGLGGGGTAAATFTGNVPNGQLRFVSDSAVFTNYAAIVMTRSDAVEGTYYFGSESESKFLVQMAPFTASVGAYKITKLYLKNNVEFASGELQVRNYPYLYHYGSGTVRIGDIDAVLGHYSQAIVYFRDLRLACRSLAANSGLAPSDANNVIFEKADCLGAGTPLRPYANGMDAGKVTFNLNGFDQTVASLRQINGRTGAGSIVYSERPATLTSAGTATGAETVRYRIEGAVSYVHDTPYATTFDQYKATSTGSLTVSKGKVAFTNGAGWSGDSVTVKSGGRLEFLSIASLTSGKHELAVEDGGALEVAEGVSLKVQSARIGSVTLQPSMVYTMDDVRAIVPAGSGISIEGSGSIQTSAKSIPGEWAGWPEAGTADSGTVPDGAVAEICDADVDKVQSLSSIDTGIGSRIVCKTSGRVLNLTASVSGGCTFEGLSAGTVVLNGDNSGLVNPGGFFFSNTTVVVSNMFGLGASRSGTAVFWPAAPLASNYSTLRFGGDATTNNAPIAFNYGFCIYHEDPAVRFVQNNGITQSNGGVGGAQRGKIWNDFTIASNCTVSVYCTQQNADGAIRIERGALLKLASGNFGNGYYYIDGEVSGMLAIEQGMRRFVFNRANALSGVTECRFYDGSEKKFFFDLNGFDQTLPRVIGNQYGTTPYQQCFDVTSETTPATLTLNAAAGRNCGAAIRVLGQASLAYSGQSTQTIGFAVSTTAGSLTVNSGAVAFERGAKWLGPDVVLNGGALIVRPTAATNTFGTGAAATTDLRINGSGRLELQSSAFTSTVRTVSLGGSLLRRGVYSAGNASWISGPGAIRAVKGLPEGLCIILK